MKTLSADVSTCIYFIMRKIIFISHFSQRQKWKYIAKAWEISRNRDACMLCSWKGEFNSVNEVKFSPSLKVILK